MQFTGRARPVTSHREPIGRLGAHRHRRRNGGTGAAGIGAPISRVGTVGLPVVGGEGVHCPYPGGPSLSASRRPGMVGWAGRSRYGVSRLRGTPRNPRRVRGRSPRRDWSCTTTPPSPMITPPTTTVFARPCLDGHARLLPCFHPCCSALCRRPRRFDRRRADEYENQHHRIIVLLTFTERVGNKNACSPIRRVPCGCHPRL